MCLADGVGSSAGEGSGSGVPDAGSLSPPKSRGPRWPTGSAKQSEPQVSAAWDRSLVSQACLLTATEIFTRTLHPQFSNKIVVWMIKNIYHPSHLCTPKRKCLFWHLLLQRRVTASRAGLNDIPCVFQTFCLISSCQRCRPQTSRQLIKVENASHS